MLDLRWRGYRPDDWAYEPQAFDIHNPDPRFIENPYPTYARLRDESPVHRNADGTFLVTRYDDVKAIFAMKAVSNRKDVLFRKQFGDSPIMEHHSSVMVFRDPPEHVAIRQTISRAFTPPALAKFEPQVDALVAELVQGLRRKGDFDLVEDLAYPLPVWVITTMMGVPVEDRSVFTRWSAGISMSLEPLPTPEQTKEANAVVVDMKDYFRDLLNERRRRPGDDLISLLVSGEREGYRLSEQDLLHNCAFLLTAGHETTSSLLAAGVMALLAFPDQMQLLVQDENLVASAVDEFLRYDSPNQLGGRTIKEELVLHGVRIPADTFVWVSNGAANHDERKFENPEQVDIRRNPNPHLAFGHGLHLCLGASLARLEGRSAFKGIREILPHFRLTGEVVRRPRARHRGFKSIPMSLA